MKYWHFQQWCSYLNKLFFNWGGPLNWLTLSFEKKRKNSVNHSESELNTRQVDNSRNYKILFKGYLVGGCWIWSKINNTLRNEFSISLSWRTLTYQHSMHCYRVEFVFVCHWFYYKVSKNQVWIGSDINTIANYRWNYTLRNDHGISDFNYSDISAVYDI